MDIRLQRIDPAVNCFRAYELSIEADLFGSWVLVVSWGRIGRPGRMRIVCSSGDRDTVRIRAERLLRLRARHGYEMVGKGAEVACVRLTASGGTMCEPTYETPSGIRDGSSSA